MHVHSEGLDAPTVVPALINDYLTGYLLALAAVAALMNSMPPTTGWDDVPAGEPEIPHYPSKLAQSGDIYGLVECFGIEDRSVGGGIMSLASPSLMQYVMAHRND